MSISALFLTRVFSILILMLLPLFSYAAGNNKYRVTVSAPTGLQMSGYNRAFFIECDDDVKNDDDKKNSASFMVSDEISYVKTFNPATGAVNPATYIHMVKVFIKLLECEMPEVIQRVEIRFNSTHLGSMDSELIREFDDTQAVPFFVLPEKNTTKNTPNIVKTTVDNVFSVDTSGKPLEFIKVADTPFTITVKRFLN